MNIELKLIQGFKQYLKEQNELILNNEEKYDVNSLNIFSLYKNEFQEYLSCTYDIDYSSLFSEDLDKNIFSDINYENGKFVSKTQDHENSEILVELLNALAQENEFSEAYDIDFDGEMSQDEYNSMLFDLQSDKSSGLTGVLDNMNAINVYFNNENNIKLHDLNNDGILSEDEKNNAKKMISVVGGADGVLAQENINLFIQLFDSDMDGVLSDEESIITRNFLDTIQEKFSLEQLNSIQGYINSMLQNPEFNIENLTAYLNGFNGDFSNIKFDDFVNISAGINTNEIMEEKGAGSLESYDNYQANTGQSSTRGSSSPAFEEQNVSNMNIEDLENELTKANANVQITLKNYENALNEIDSVKAKELSDIQITISDINSNIDEINNSITQKTNEISNLETNILSYENLISSEKSKDEPNQELIQNYEVKIKELEKQKNALNEEIGKLEEQKNNLNGELEIQNANLSAKMDEISSLYPQLTDLKEKYDAALKYVSEVEQTLALRKTDREKSENADMISLDNGSKDYRNNPDDYSNLPLTYTLDGKEYHCVGFAGYDTDGDGEVDFQIDSWEEAQRYLANGGVRNIGQYGTMQCHNYSAVACDLVLGTLNSDLTNALIAETEDANYGDKDTAGYMGTQIGTKEGKYNTRAYAQCKVSGREEQIEIIKNELQNGRPCLVSVPYTGGQHYVSAIGLSDDGDVLIWDSYDGSIQRLGTSSGEERRVIATGNGVMVATPGHTYCYNSGEYLNYWDEYVENSMDDIISTLQSRKK